MEKRKAKKQISVLFWRLVHADVKRESLELPSNNRARKKAFSK